MNFDTSYSDIVILYVYAKSNIYVYIKFWNTVLFIWKNILSLYAKSSSLILLEYYNVLISLKNNSETFKFFNKLDLKGCKISSSFLK